MIEPMNLDPAKFVPESMKRLGLNRRQLSLATGTNYDTLRKWEYGVSPTLEKWKRFVEKVQELESAK